MEAASASSSKVTVQCTDPSKVLGVFEGKFVGRTPLKSLHWKSPSRPLRSIPLLHITLVQNEGAQNGAHANIRRHQIPGLRETPYVKLYLLRCDDKETYKETARKEIKQWIKDNTLEKESKSSLRNQEHHDAFEWMIVHLVLPNTPAASQPKSSKHISLETTDSTDSVNSKSKWTGKSPSTIYDKLRADFSSSKAAVPRVAQVRITEPGKPTGRLSATEIEEQWTEFVDSLKACILKSFSMRVAQYEEGIREREAQRSLPGWNFCTFFVLKEGLARGFESLGLLDDALGVYDELEVGLDLLIKDRSSQDEVDSTGGLLPYSRDLKAKIREALDEPGDDSKRQSTQPSEMTLEEIIMSRPESHPFDLQRRQYRDLILTNQVSALDLRIYIFTRRMELLLARACISVSALPTTQPTHRQKDLNVLADLLERSLEFITSASRQLRADLTDAYGGRLVGKDRALQAVIVGNMVASWTWSAIMQIIATSMPILDNHDTPDPPMINRSVQHANGLQLEQDTGGSHTPSELDVASTSSSPQRKLVPLAEGLALSNGGPGTLNVQGERRVPHGLDRLAAWTARLIVLARNVVEELQSCRVWADELRQLEVSGFQAISRKLYRFSTVHDVASSNEGLGNDQASLQPGHDDLQSLEPPALLLAASSQEKFYAVYNALSQAAYRLFSLAGGLRAAQQVLLDIASLAFCHSEIEEAAQSLQKLVVLQESGEAFQAQPYALALYAQCLKSLDRPEDYINCLLACMQCRPLSASHSTAQSYVDELFRMAPIASASEVPFSVLAEVSSVDQSISHLEDQDSFCLSLRLRSRVSATYTIVSPLVLVLKAAEKQEPSEIVLKSSNDIELSPNGTVVLFRSTVGTTGWFEFDRLQMRIGKISLICPLQDTAGRNPMAEMSLSRPDLGLSSVFIYPRSDAPKLELLPSPNIFLGETRRVAVTIRNEKRQMSNCTLRVRAGTAGLRLRIHEAEPLDETSEMEVARDNDITFLRFPNLGPDQLVIFEIPYTLENASDASISIKFELGYEAGHEIHTLHETCAADVLLPISVNVQDIYRPSYWFSRFHVSPSTLVPIVVLGYAIENDQNIAIEESSGFEEVSMVFPHQPAHWTVRLRGVPGDGFKAQRKLNLLVRYKCLDEVILNSLRNAFANDLDKAGLSDYSQPLVSHLMQNLKAGWTEQDLEVAGLTREMEMWHKGDLNWSSLLCAFDRLTKAKLDQWLNGWHQTRSSLELDLSSAPIRTLKLAVELPPRPPVITTSLTVLHGISGADVATLGQPLVCELSIEKSMPPGKGEEEMEFVFELFAHADAWLIGGRKKGNLLTSQTSMQCQVILFPQKVGTVLLPMIDIRCRRRQGSSNELEWVAQPIELYNRTTSTTVNVTPNLRSTTVGVGSEDGIQVGTGALLASKSRDG